MEREKNKIRTGYRVIGGNLFDGQLHCWCFHTLDLANKFAAQLAADTDKEVDVCKYLGSWRRKSKPAKFIPSKD